jgi:cytochrome P450
VTAASFPRPPEAEGLPSIAEIFGADMAQSVAIDPFPIYRELRETRPVLPVFGLGQRLFVVTRYADVREALRRDDRFSNRSNATGISLVMGRTIVEMDGREHLRHRNIVTPALAPRALKGDFPETVASIAHSLIDTFARRGRVDLVEKFTFSYPLRVFTRILGLPVEDYDRIHRWGIDLTLVATDPAQGLEAARLLGDYLRPVVEKRRSQPTDDLISRLVTADVEGQRLSDEEVISFLRLLVVAGAETTYHLIGSALFGLLRTPEQLEAVRADRSLIRPVLDEALRWESPVQIVTRQTTEDVEVSGAVIPSGATVLLGVGSANRDERHFDHPDRFDIERFAGGSAEVDHVAFGLGRHYCAGSRLAYLEAEVALGVLLDRLPNLRLESDTESRVVGLAFRGPDRLPVRFD